MANNKSNNGYTKTTGHMNIAVGQVFNNYKELCEALGDPVKKGKSKILQMRKWQKYFSYEKIEHSNGYIITGIVTGDSTLQYYCNESKNEQKAIRADTIYFDLFEKSLLLYIYNKYHHNNHNHNHNHNRNKDLTIAISKTELCRVTGLSNDSFWQDYGMIMNYIKQLNGNNNNNSNDDDIDEDGQDIDLIVKEMTQDNTLCHLNIQGWYDRYKCTHTDEYVYEHTDDAFNRSTLRQDRAEPEDINTKDNNNNNKKKKNKNNRVNLSYILSPEEKMLQYARLTYTKIYQRALGQMAKVTVNGRHYVKELDLDGIEVQYKYKDKDKDNKYKDIDEGAAQIIRKKASPAFASQLECVQNMVISTVFKRKSAFSFFQQATDNDLLLLKQKTREIVCNQYNNDGDNDSDLVYYDHMPKIYMTFDMEAVEERLAYICSGNNKNNNNNARISEDRDVVKSDLNTLVVSAIRSRIICDAYNYMVMAYGYWDKIREKKEPSKTFLYHYSRVKRSVTELNGADKPSAQVAMYLKRMYLMMLKVCYDDGGDDHSNSNDVNIDECMNTSDSYFLNLVDMYKNDKGAKRDNWDEG